MRQNETTDVRIRYLMLSRVAVATFLLGIATFLDIKGEDFLPEISVFSLYIVAIATYVLSIVFYIILNFIPEKQVTLYAQGLCDATLVTGLVFATGGIQSIYVVFYIIVIIYSVIFLGRRGGLIIASTCGILYGVLLDLEYYKILIPSYAVLKNISFSAGYVFSKIVINIFSFYLIALLASFVVERGIKAQSMLEEKVSAFDQLDQLHHSIIESIDTGIITIDLGGKIKSFNRAAGEITGYSRKEVDYISIYDIFPNYAGIYDQFVHSQDADLRKKRIEITIRNKSGRFLILGCAISALRDAKDKHIGDILVFQDLTEIKKMERGLEASRRLAFIGEMAAGLAHEMRNPLASMGGSIQMLRKGLVLSYGDERLMSIILRGKEQLEALMKDFLFLSKPMPSAQDTVVVADIIDDVLAAVKFVPDWSNNTEVLRSVAGGMELLGAVSEVRQLIWNLVMNAVQAMPEGGRLSIVVRQAMLPASAPALEIEIADSGKGIATEDTTKIFEPFFTKKEIGTGLGLAIVNRIVDSYRGTIVVDSSLGRGTKFTVTLPRKIRGDTNGKNSGAG